ncbi:MAG: dihydrolipoamide acetyltransferase family protein [Ilumatobacteraceae bacterium]
MPEAPTERELVPFTMPALGADMDTGTVVEWLIKPGSVVHRGDVVAIVETDKNDLDVEVFADGTVVDLVVPAGEKVAVGTTLALLAPEGRVERPLPQPTQAPRRPLDRPAPEAATRPASPAPVVTPLQLTSPVLRRLAADHHIDVTRVHGSGPGGRITRDDIEHAERRAAVTPRARRLARQHGVDLSTLAGRVVTGDDVLQAASSATAQTLPPASPSEQVPAKPVAGDTMRRTIARLMTKAWQEIPHYHVASRIDLRSCLAELDKINENRSAAGRVLSGAVLASAAARAAAEVPGVNGYWLDESFVQGEGVHLGIVVALRSGGLLAPVIRDANDKTVDEVMNEMRDLVTRARTGRLRATEMVGATFTLTELGEGAVDSVTPIIHPPQVAILGLGSVHDEPWAEQGMLDVRPVVHATLAGDHRAIDGRLGSLYLTTLSRFLQEPMKS